MELDPSALAMVVFVDLVLSGDNAVVIGLAAAALPAEHRRMAIVWGIGLAVAMRILFAMSALQLLQITGIKLFGGLLLLWVCYRLWQDLVVGGAEEEIDIASVGAVPAGAATGHMADTLFSPAFLRAMTSILMADLSMSLDNVLAVAGVAKGNMTTLVFGLGLSILLMAVAASAIARTLKHHRWVGYVGLAIILWVAGEMIWHGGLDLRGYFGA